MIEVENIFKKHKFLLSIFIISALISILFACIVQRCMYLDGGLWFNIMLDKISHGSYGLFDDTANHPRLFGNLINQFLVNFTYYILQIKNKYILSFSYSLSLFLFPLLATWWNYKLSDRTKRFDIAFWTLFVYVFLIIQSSIFSVVETNLVSILYLVLFNYLAGEINYTKKDTLIISALLIFLFRSHEMVLYLGVIIFFASLFYAKREENTFNKIIKYLIGIGSFCASIYMVSWFLTKHITNDTVRFASEAVQYLHLSLRMNLVLTIVGLLIGAIAFFIKKEFTNRQILIIASIYALLLINMFAHLDIFLNPMAEGQLRTIVCWAIPLIFIMIFMFDSLKIKIDKTYLSNMLVIIYIVGISHNIWQINNSYWFYKDFEYLKSKLTESKTALLNPDENPDLFDRSKHRLYNNEFTYFNISLALNDDYKIKSVLSQSKSPNGFSEWLFKIDDKTIMIPTANLSIKNKFWDLTDVANELETKRRDSIYAK